MAQSPNDAPISVMEDLDPEPPSRGASSRRRELVLGLALLVGVLGWAGWQWWYTATITSNYEQGQQAETARRWDEARALFTAASGYKDADAHAAGAAQKIEERDAQYHTASAHATAGDWLGSLQAARAAATIQPGYADVDRLQANAEREVYRQAVSGTVALRAKADPPGLYYRDVDGWTWLQGSDKWSRVQGSGTPGKIVYDVPGPLWKAPVAPTATPLSHAQQTGQPELLGRRLMVMDVARGAAHYSFTPLSLDPAQYNTLQWGDRGVWGRRFGMPANGYITVRKGYFGDPPPDYEAFGSPITATVAITGAEGVATYLAQGGDRVLIAGYGQPYGGEASTVLWIAEGDGSNPRPLYTLVGHDRGFDLAQLSPDGRHALLITFTPVTVGGKDKEDLMAFLLDAVGDAPPLLLALSVQDAPGTSGNDYARLGLAANFLNTGHFAGKLLLAWPSAEGGNNLRLSLLDPDKPNTPLMSAQVEGDGTAQAHLVEDEGSGDLLLTLILDPEQPRLDRQPQTLLHITPGNGPSGTPHVATYRMGMARLPVFQQARIWHDRLIFSSLYHSKDTVSFRLSTMPLADIEQPAVQETVLYSVELERNGSGFPKGESANIGAGALAYLKNGELRARAYGSNVDLPLEEGITELFDLKLFSTLHWSF